jgi:hypothetical protein
MLAAANSAFSFVYPEQNADLHQEFVGLDHNRGIDSAESPAFLNLFARLSGRVHFAVIFGSNSARLT